MKTHFPTVPVETARQKGVEIDAPRPLVLVVDDEPLILETLSAILDGNGLAVITAQDAPAALEMARIMPPDILISDIAMPGMSGLDLAVEMSKAVPDCDTLLFSGEPSTCDQIKNYHAQGFDFVTMIKPVHPTELLACVFELLSLRGWLVPNIQPRNLNPADPIFFGPISQRARERAKGIDPASDAAPCRGPVPHRRNSRA